MTTRRSSRFEVSGTVTFKVEAVHMAGDAAEAMTATARQLESSLAMVAGSVSGVVMCDLTAKKKSNRFKQERRLMVFSSQGEPTEAVTVTGGEP